MTGARVDRESARRRRAARTTAHKPLAPDVDFRNITPMGRIELQGEYLRDAKYRLRDRSPARRWAARFVFLITFGPIVVFLASMLVQQLISTFG